MDQLSYTVERISCNSCRMLVTEELEELAGVGPIALSAGVLAVVDLVLAIVLRASSSSDSWTTIVNELQGGLANVVRLLVAWTLVVFVFAFVRRQDADAARFSVAGPLALWVVIGAWTLSSVSFAVNDRDQTLADRITAAVFGAALADGGVTGPPGAPEPPDAPAADEEYEDYEEYDDYEEYEEEDF